MKQYNSTTLVRTIWSLLLVISALCLTPVTAEAQFKARVDWTRPTIKGLATPSGQIILSLTSDAPSYTIKITAHPTGYTGPVTLTSTKQKTIVYNLPAGSYKLEVTDASNAVRTLTATVREATIRDFSPNAYWSQLHTSNNQKLDWISTALFDTQFGNVQGYSCAIDTLAKYFDIAVCSPNDYYNGYEKGLKDLNWMTIRDEHTAPTFNNEYGFWSVQDPTYDSNAQPTGQTVERTHLFVKVPDGMSTPNEMYYRSNWAIASDDTKTIGLVIRVKGSKDPKNSNFSKADWYFNGKKSFDPNNWLEVTPVKPHPCEGYRPLIRIKEAAIQEYGLKFPIKVRAYNKARGYGSSSELELTFTEDNYMTPQTFDERAGGLGFAVWNKIYMSDSDGHDSSLGLNPMGAELGAESYRYTYGAGVHGPYTDKYRHWDEHRGWVWTPYREKDKHGVYGVDFCAGTRDLVYTITISESFYGYHYKVAFANAQVTLLEAPDGYEAVQKKYKYFPKLGETFTVPEKHTSCDFYPFPNDEQPEDNPYMEPCYDVKIPEGRYVFKIIFINTCGDEKTISDVGKYTPPFSYRAVKYKFSQDAQALDPQYEKISCNTIRLYPFRGAKSRNVLMRNDQSVPIYVKAVQTTVDSYGYTRHVDSGYLTYDPSKSPDPWDCYIELKWEGSTIDIQYNYENSFGDPLPCLNEGKTQLIVKTEAPTYARDKLYTYICPGGQTAHVSVLPIRTAGETVVELRDVKDKNKLYGSKTIASTNLDKPAVFELTGEQVQPEYILYIKTGTGDCALDNGGEIIKMSDLGGSSFIIGAFNTKYCEGEKVTIECPPITPESEYTWTTPDGTQMTGRKITFDAATLKLSGEWKLEVSNVPCEGAPATQTVPFILSVAPSELWWRKDAKSADWNSLDNWADKLGKPIKASPAKCTDVHLPAVVDQFYPNLAPDKTTGDAVCNDIYFHFGSALGEPQRLTHYSRAYIDYNFGIVQPDGTIKAHEDPDHPGAYDRILSRDEWHLLSTPIKNVYAGDFALGGYPLTYQCYLKVEELLSFRKEVFERPINKLGRLIGAYNYGLAFKVEGYHPEKLGAKDHKNLNGLEGIIRLPFYENKERAPYYPLHRYYEKWYWYDYDQDKDEGKVTDEYPNPASYFAYFDLNTLKAVAKVDSVKRYPTLDYRFLFEDDKTNVIGTTLDADGKEVEGYTLRVSRPAVSGNLFTLVGNPFMCPIDYDRLFKANENNNLRPGLYVYADGAWRLALKRGGRTMGAKRDRQFDAIAPLQAFVVFLNSENPKQTLYFPTAPAEISVLRDPNTSKFELRSTEEEPKELSERYVAVTVTDERGGYASAELLPEDTEESMPALFASESMQTAPLVYFISPTDSTCNFVQTNVPGAVVELGVFAPTEGMLTLDFTTLTEKPFDKLALYDRLRGTEQDLLANPTYSYGYSERDGRRFELRMSYGNVRYEEQQDHQPDLAIERTATGYRISYDQGIAAYQLYSVQGYLLERATTDGQTQVDIEMPETEVVLLDVQSADGLRWIKKLQR